jgi:hypothetical protein
MRALVAPFTNHITEDKSRGLNRDRYVKMKPKRINARQIKRTHTVGVPFFHPDGERILQSRTGRADRQ